MAVYVLARNKVPLNPCSERRARILLARGRARIHKLRPFVIRLIDRTTSNGGQTALTVRIDPGSKKSGLALTREVLSGGRLGDGSCNSQTVHVVNLLELEHRGALIRNQLLNRRGFRRRRRSKLRFRPKRFRNRTRPPGWLPPSLQHRVDAIVWLVRKLQKYATVRFIVTELVCFDMQRLQDASIRGVAYQKGTLMGENIREYLLNVWGYRCAYCDAEKTKFQIDHIQPRCHGGSHRLSNLCLSCVSCNLRKGSQSLTEFLKKDSRRMQMILAKTKVPLIDAAAVNCTRRALLASLQNTGLSVTSSSGAQTAHTRIKLQIPKTHSLDAACCGQVDILVGWKCPTLLVKACGRGSYRRTRLDKFGFPRGYSMRRKQVHGFATGDLVRALVPQGKKQGAHVGRVAIRATGQFNISTAGLIVQGIGYKYCQILQRGDGYALSYTVSLARKDSEADRPCEQKKLDRSVVIKEISDT